MGASTSVEPETSVISDLLRGVDLVRGIFAADSLWIPHGDGVLYRIDPASRTVTDEIPVRSGWEPPHFADGAIWVASPDYGTVSRLDPQTAEVTHRVDVDRGGGSSAVLDGAVWVRGRERHRDPRRYGDAGERRRIGTLLSDGNGSAGPRPRFGSPEAGETLGHCQPSTGHGGNEPGR